jgi:hypothetical protein
MDAPGGIRLADASADKRLRSLLEAARVGFVRGLSVPLHLPDELGVAVLHALPVSGQAGDIFLDGGMILLITATK